MYNYIVKKVNILIFHKFIHKPYSNIYKCSKMKGLHYIFYSSAHLIFSVF